MINRMDVAAISQYGQDHNSPLELRRKAAVLFSRALRRGRVRSFWHRLVGRERGLRDLAQIAGNARQQPSRSAGIVHIPLAQIVGSENRVRDFDGAFNPLSEHSRDRWIGIAAARRRGTVLPPVDLIQLGDEYYVRDGHHRISVAGAAGQKEIEANILYMMV